MKKIILSILCIFFVTLACYSNSFHADFQFDGIEYLENNTTLSGIHDIKGIWSFERKPTRFITLLSFALNNHFHRGDVFGFHVVNFLIHFLNAVLVWILVGIFLNLKASAAPYLKNHQVFIPLAVALFFASHPIQTQSVTYIYQRLASLATMFYLTTILFYVKARIAEGKEERNILFFLAALSALLAMFSKEISFTLPIIICFIEFYFFFEREKIDWQRVRPFITVLFIFLLIVPALFSFKIGWVFTERWSESYKGDVYTTYNYFLTQFRVIPQYIKLLFFPIGLNLDYHMRASQTLLVPITTLIGLIFLLSLVILSIVLFRRHRLASFGIVWFFVTQLVESSIIPIRHVIFEHRVYLPSFGFFLSVVCLFAYLLKNKKVFAAVSSIIVVIFSVLTYQRNLVWKTRVGLWQYVARKSPNKPRAYNNLGMSYVHEKNNKLAVENFSRAIELDDTYDSAYSNRGLLYLGQGKVDLAIADFTKAIESNPGFVKAYNNRANVYKRIGKWQLALDDYNKAIEQAPNYTSAYSNRGNLYKSLRQFDLALKDLTKAIELSPEFALAYNNRGLVYTDIKEYGLALEDFNKAIQLLPGYDKSYNNRGVVYKSLGRYDFALADFNKALSLNPSLEEAYNNIGHIYELQSEYDKAITYYNQALSVNPKYAKTYANRGFVYLTMGDRVKAFEDFQKAIDVEDQKELAYFHRSLAYFTIKDFDKAWEDLQTSINLGFSPNQDYVNALKDAMNRK